MSDHLALANVIEDASIPREKTQRVASGESNRGRDQA